MPSKLSEKQAVKTVESLVDDFAQSHGSKKITEREVRDLYHDIGTVLSKDYAKLTPVDLRKYEDAIEQNVKDTVAEINKIGDRTVSTTDKLMHGLGKICSKIPGLKDFGKACMERLQAKEDKAINLKGSLEKITGNILKSRIDNEIGQETPKQQVKAEKSKSQEVVKTASNLGMKIPKKITELASQKPEGSKRLSPEKMEAIKAENAKRAAKKNKGRGI